MKTLFDYIPESHDSVPGYLQTEYHKLTPGMKQFVDIKKQYPDCLVLFRMGDFFETFYDDAQIASKELDIVLTSRGTGEKKAPLAGIPYHALDPYLSKLIKKGYKVAIVEQLEDPKKAKGLVKRGLVRIVTPGTLIDETLLDEKSNNFIMAIYAMGETFGTSVCDISTGEFFISVCTQESLGNLLVRYSPKECIVPSSLCVNTELLTLLKSHNAFINPLSDTLFSLNHATLIIQDHFKVMGLLGLGLHDDCVVSAAGGLLSYLHQTQMNSLSYINSIKSLNLTDTMLLDSATIRNLELIENMREGKTQGTLISVLDQTKTPMGSRLLSRWIKEPLLKKEAIKERLMAVSFLSKATTLRMQLPELLDQMYDLERLISRINYGNANARDLLALKKSLAIIPTIAGLFDKTLLILLKNLKEMDHLHEIVTLIEKSIIDDAPFSLREGGFINPESDPVLKELSEIKKDSRIYLKNLEEQEKAKTNIRTLKIGFNNVFGYYIEVSKSYMDSVPAHYIRKQTTANGERYITQELKEHETRILTAQDKSNELEYSLFFELTKKIIEKTVQIQKISHEIAQLDVLLSFAQCAVSYNYCEPEINDGHSLSLIHSRHPVIERLSHSFVPNTVELQEHEVMLITGPNMAGKSTFMRQVALNVLMAQIGCFVPAQSATIGLTDRIFTRVGAHDELSSGQSTFMVEMNETANILNNATQKSLIILDEIGRGTSTYDGVSIAWSVMEHIATKIKAKTLFATHYHVLNILSDFYQNISNYNIAVKEEEDEIIFLRKILKGGTDKSYGIHVAKLSGMPKEIISRAKEIQAKLENEDHIMRTIIDHGKNT